MSDLRTTSNAHTTLHLGQGVQAMTEKGKTLQVPVDGSPSSSREGSVYGVRLGAATRAVSREHHDQDAGSDHRSQADAAFGTAHRKFANPSPFGFFCLATSIMTVALVNFGARGVAVTTFLAAPAIWVAGVGQLLAGMWEMACGNTLGATGFTVYGLWWISFGWYLSPWSNIAAAYAENPTEMGYIGGFYSIAYLLFSLCLVVAALRTTLSLLLMFVGLSLVYLVTAIGAFAQSEAFAIAAGVFGVLTSLAAFYNGLATLFANEASYFQLPVGDRQPKVAEEGEVAGRA